MHTICTVLMLKFFLTIEEMFPPVNTTLICSRNYAVPIRSDSREDYQRSSIRKNKGIDGRKSQVSMQIEKTKVDAALFRFEFAKQEVRNQQSAYR